MNKHRRIAIILFLIMAGCILLYDAIFWGLNLFLPLQKISLSESMIDLVQVRIVFRNKAESAVQIITNIFIIGNIYNYFVICHKGYIVGFRNLLISAGIVTLIFISITIPFALFDSEFANDYFYPLWKVLPILLIVLPILCFIELYRSKKSKGVKNEL